MADVGQQAMGPSGRIMPSSQAGQHCGKLRLALSLESTHIRWVLLNFVGLDICRSGMSVLLAKELDM